MKWILILLLASVSSAASWDGTKGNITISTQSDSAHTVVSISTTDPETFGFWVMLTKKCFAAPNTCKSSWKRVFVLRHPGAEPSLAVFDEPGSLALNGVIVVEQKITDSQTFGGN